MRQKGRKTAVSVALSRKVAQAVERPEPALDLTPEQADVWTDVVNTMPADWFPPETHGNLIQYCRHVVEARHIAQLIDQCKSRREDFDVRQYNQLLKMQRAETDKINITATKMRLTQQSRYGARGAESARNRTAVQEPPPWLEG